MKKMEPMEVFITTVCDEKIFGTFSETKPFLVNPYALACYDVTNGTNCIKHQWGKLYDNIRQHLNDISLAITPTEEQKETILIGAIKKWISFEELIPQVKSAVDEILKNNTEFKYVVISPEDNSNIVNNVNAMVS